jgi:NAD(P)-dependent dehydrogenase (short-subunit alcohol dehydrogenase family)
MAGRLAGKTAVVVGAGQTPGETIGNGRAMAMLFAREGARVLCVDRILARAEETAAMIGAEGGEASAFEADVTDAEQAKAILETGQARLGRVDILVNNVGIGGTQGGRDGPAQQGGGAIVNISSLASYSGGNQIAYEVSKAGVNRLTTSVAAANAKYRVRCNAVLPGLMDTPMAIEGIARASGRTTDETRAARNARVPMGQMGTAWDTAHAALFLASDDAKFITGALLVVDGGMHVR